MNLMGGLSTFTALCAAGDDPEAIRAVLTDATGAQVFDALLAAAFLVHGLVNVLGECGDVSWPWFLEQCGLAAVTA